MSHAINPAAITAINCAKINACTCTFPVTVGSHVIQFCFVSSANLTKTFNDSQSLKSEINTTL